NLVIILELNPVPAATNTDNRLRLGLRFSARFRELACSTPSGQRAARRHCPGDPQLGQKTEINRTSCVRHLGQPFPGTGHSVSALWIVRPTHICTTKPAIIPGIQGVSMIDAPPTPLYAESLSVS